MVGAVVCVLAIIDLRTVRWSPNELHGVVVAIHGDSTDAGPFIRAVDVRLNVHGNVTAERTELPIREGSVVTLTEGRTRILQRKVFRITRIGD